MISQQHSKFISYNGKNLSITEWAKELGCSVSGLSLRIKKFNDKYGLDKVMNLSWNPERTQQYGTEHFENEIIKLYSEGKSYVEITKELGCTASTIKRFLKKNDITIRPAHSRSSIEINKKKNTILNLLKDNPFNEIEKITGIKMATLKYHIKNWI